jgi:glyoxylase-like metal-dependent hydrolase (beta-lactamase superfamily II)
LPFPGLHRVSAYLLADDSGSTLVDCGIFIPDEADDHGWDDLVAALAACDHELKDIARLVVTHPHIDHYGMAARMLEETGCELWMHERAADDLAIYRDPAPLVQNLKEMFAEHGVPSEDVEELARYEDWRGFISGVVDATNWLKGGETADIGGRRWEMVYTPGHSRAHVCVWTAGDSVLLSGDHLLPSITPHIDFKRGEDVDPLGDFLESLKKVEELAPKLVLPGHGSPFEDGAERARIVARHHDRRLGSILQVIRHKPATANEITDEIFGSTLLHFQRRLALGEALAHLAYLRRRGEIERTKRDDGVFVYQKVKRQRPEEHDE